MSLQLRRWRLVFGTSALAMLLGAGVYGVFGGPGARAESPAKAEPEQDPALARTREQVRMLDDLYKNAVVSITTRYVDGKDDQPAIKVAQDVFGAMKKQGWHNVKLVDATGDPISQDNLPRTDFEKTAARLIASGQPYYDRVVGEGSQRRLLAATVVPVVMQKCTECHTDKKLGEVLGFLRYDVPVK